MITSPKYGREVEKSFSVPEGDSAAQLRREAAKARSLADNAFAEEERRALLDVAASLEREAVAIETKLAVQRVSAARSPRGPRTSPGGPKS